MGFAETPGTLAGYDIVLSISAEAINSQFKTLWEKPIPSATLPPPPSIPGMKIKLPRPKFFISHDFQVFPQSQDEGDDGLDVDGEVSSKARKKDEEEEEEDSDPTTMEGLNAHILAPVIKFPTDPKKQGTAVITLTFFRDETVEDERQRDSVMQYWVVNKGKPRFIKININDWKMSWEVDVQQRDIDNVVRDLLDPAQSKDSSIQLPDKAMQQFRAKFQPTDKQVDPSVFTASSIFCVMNSVKISNSFDIQPPEGTKITEGSALARITTMVVQYFSNVGKVQDPKMPTPQNPFVLGYSIRQSVPSLRSINEDADPKKTPRYFLPRSVDTTTTARPEDLYTGGTLNFCMLTQRPQGELLRDVPLTESDGGRFNETFFKTLRTFGGAGSTARPGGHDGIMGFSREIFRDYWLQEYLVQKLIAKPENYGGALRQEGTDTSVTLRKKTPTTDKQNNISRIDYEYNEIACPDESVYKQKRTANGHNWVKASYYSDFSRYNEQEKHKIDLKRNLYIDLTVHNELNLNLYTKGLNSFGQDFNVIKSVSEWFIGRTAQLRSRFKIAYNLTPGQGGIWSIEKDSGRTTFPGNNVPIDDLGGAKKNDDVPWDWANWNEDGCQLWLRNHHTFKVFGQDAEMKKFSDNAKKWYDYHDDDVFDAVESITGSLKNAVIMPAGNVLTFKGLDTDADGNVYSSVDYMTLTPDAS